MSVTRIILCNFIEVTLCFMYVYVFSVLGVCLFRRMREGYFSTNIGQHAF